MKANIISDNYYDEYYNGELEIKPSLDNIHNIIIKQLSLKLSNTFKCYLYDINLLIANKDINLTAVRPDLSVYTEQISTTDLVKSLEFSKKSSKMTAKIPEIVFEILTDPDNGNEMILKPKIYKDFGVTEYWIIDLCSQSVSIFDNYNEGYIVYKFCSKILASLAFDNLFLNFEDIYADLVSNNLIKACPIQKQVGIYAEPGFDPWEWINREM